MSFTILLIFSVIIHNFQNASSEFIVIHNPHYHQYSAWKEVTFTNIQWIALSDLRSSHYFPKYNIQPNEFARPTKLSIFSKSNFTLKFKIATYCPDRMINFTIFQKVFFPKNYHSSRLKAQRQIFKKQYFEKYFSCDKSCQFSALQGTPWQSYLENPTNEDKIINKRVRLYIHQICV